MRTSRFPLVDLLLDGRLTELLTDWRNAGDSHAEIAYRLRSEHSIPVSKETIRRWCIESGAEPEVGEPKAVGQ